MKEIHSVLSSVLFFLDRILKYSGTVLFDGVLSLPVKFKRSMFRSGDSFRITIPMPIIKELDLKEKDELLIWLDDHQIIMRKKND